MAQKVKFDLPIEYSNCIKISNPFFKSIFEFENALKLTIDCYLTICYDDMWWEKHLKIKNIGIYNYVNDLKLEKTKMPWIGSTSSAKVREIQFLTLGQIEVIVDNFKSECIPEIFPRLDFLTGHMMIIKKVRNLFAHMHPSITKEDIKIANHEMFVLSKHLIEKYEYYVKKV